MLYTGDSIICGLDIENDNQILRRIDSNGTTIDYPIISTRSQPGLITLHAMGIPSNA
jgi:hypothetical protein